MTKILTEAQVQQYEKAGYVFPLRVLSEEDVAGYRQELDQYLEHARGALKSSYKHKLHLVSQWADSLVHHPKILDAVEDLIGPDILCWTSNLLLKPAQSSTFVSWHQDSQYWGLEPHEVVTAWVALSPSTLESGCVQVLPGSHLFETAGHRDTFNKDNMLTRGQELDVDIDGSQSVDMVLGSGEVSLHHIKLYHGSEPNRSSERRIGLAIRYMSARVHKRGNRESAILVRGTDAHRHFFPEQRPTADFSAAGRMAHNRAVRLQVGNNFDAHGQISRRQKLRLSVRKRLSQVALDAFYFRWKVRGWLGG